MSIETLRTSLPAYANDIKINLANLLSEENANELSLKQSQGIALAAAFTTKNEALIAALLQEASKIFTGAEIDAIKGAVTIMSMNNIYYRFLHLVSDKQYASMPARLRMNIISNHGVDKIDFELYCLAISAINGCGMCMDSHEQQLVKAGVSKLAIQNAIKIAAVINATAATLFMKDQESVMH